MEHTGRVLFSALLTLSAAGAALSAPDGDRGPRDTYVLNRGNSASISGSLEDLGTLRRREDALEEAAERELWTFLDRTVAKGAARPASGK